MPNEGYILPWGRFLTPEIIEMPVKGEECPMCNWLFTDMTDPETFRAHQARCIENKVEERRKMIGAGYKLTSTGWVLK